MANNAAFQVVCEVAEFQNDSQEYMQPEPGPVIQILHLSDLRISDHTVAETYLIQLEADLAKELGIKRLEYLVIAGDITTGATQEEYEAAFGFIDGLAKRFGLDPSRIVIVPGNHDLNWELAKRAYEFVYKSTDVKPLPAGIYIPAGDVGDLVRIDAKYESRFANFDEYLYKRVYGGQSYPADYASQRVLALQSGDSILLLGLNSAWEIDHHFRSRASINIEALSRALDPLQDGKYDHWLKIAVFHHPVTGREAMSDDFMQSLAVHGFQLVLHGHVHEAKEGLYKYDDKRRIHIIGAGAFGAPMQEQVPGIPLQYNLLTLNPATRELTVETRRKEKPDGAWMADARWVDKNNPSPRYTIQLDNWKHPSM